MVPLTHFADSSSGLGALGFSGQAFIIQLITFILAYLVLRRYAFGPILKVLQQRRETINKSVELTQQLQKEQAELQEKTEKTLTDARAQADTIIAEAQEAGRQAIREAEDKAREKAAGILAAAESRITQDTQAARKALEKELVGLISDATEAIIDEKVDAKKDAQLIDRALSAKGGARA